MAQNITLLGASYTDVPAVELPKTGGGTASFTDVTDTTAAAANVESGYYFYTANGVRTAGTGSGGGGGAEAIVVSNITPVDAGGGLYSISFQASAQPCIITVEDETRSYQLSTAQVPYPVMWIYNHSESGWRYSQAFGIRGVKYFVRTATAGTDYVSYSNGTVTILDTHFSTATTYTVKYAVEGGGGSAVIEPLSVSTNGTYTAPSGVDGYSPITVNVPQGLIIPTGYSYYGGFLLPTIPVEEGYDYAWIRTNKDAGVWNVVYGKSQWRTRSAATLDNWQLEFATLSSDGAVYYKIADDGSETAWHDRMTSTNYFGLSTSLGRKVVWTSHDIKISTTANIIMYSSPVITNPT